MTTTTRVAVPDVADAVSTQTVKPEHDVRFPSCDSCTARVATLVLTWPDRRFKLCGGCVPEELVALAEPLDLDDPLTEQH